MVDLVSSWFPQSCCPSFEFSLSLGWAYRCVAVCGERGCPPFGASISIDCYGEVQQESCTSLLATNPWRQKTPIAKVLQEKKYRFPWWGLCGWGA
jgi:hypothetical protein